MRRTALALTCLALGWLAGCAGAPAYDELPEDHWSKHPAAVPMMRIGRGAVNVAAAPLDVPATAWRVCSTQDAFGYGLGLFEGAFNAVVRAGAGVAEILSFPLFHVPEPLYQRGLGEPVFRGDAPGPSS